MSRVPEECPTGVRTLLDRCLSEDPMERPSAVEIVQEITQLLEEPSLRQTPP